MALPSGYKQIEYVESNGTGSYFKTGILPTANTRVVFDGYVISGDTALYGSRFGNGNNRYAVQYISSDLYRLSYDNTEALAPAAYTKGARYTFDQRNNQLYIDNTLAASVTAYPTYPNARELYAVGALNTNNTATNFGVVRMYSMQIYQNDALVGDFLPVQDSGGNIGIYNQVTDVFYQNAGTGNVTGGDPLMVMTGITITVLPAKTEFAYGEALDLTGMVVTASYDDGTQNVVSDYAVTGYDATAPGIQSIVVGYGGFEAVLTVTVKEPVYYTVTFKDWDGAVLKTETVIEGYAATAPVNPAREGYTFTGWNADFSVITSDLDVIALYEINQYTVIFKDWNNVILSNQTVEYGSAATAPENPVREGHTFTGWSVDFSVITSDLDVVALYTINQYTVIFKDWDDTILKEERVDYGSGATAPINPAREGYVFKGWDTDFINISEDVCITAIYEVLQVVDIEIGSFPNKLSYCIGDLFDSTGFSLNGVYNDGSKYVIESGYTFSGFSSKYFGAKTITVTYINLSIVFEVNVDTKVYNMGSRVTGYLNINNHKMVISGVGKMQDYSYFNNDPLQHLSKADKDFKLISAVTIEHGITRIGKYTFYECDSLVKVDLPESIISIGYSAFEGCSILSEIALPSSIETIEGDAFGYCESITDIVIPPNVTSLGESMFRSCLKLKSITIPNSVTKIGNYAFYSCHALTSITIPDGVTSIGDNTFAYCRALTSITIPEGVTSIGDNTFAYCRALTSITIPDGVTSIGSSAFYDCHALTSITIPKGVTSIRGGTFYDCRALTSITIPEGVTSIGYDTFAGCQALTSITIPEGVTGIGSSAFFRCDSLKTIYVNATPNAISKSPWGAYAANVIWLKVAYYTVIFQDWDGTILKTESVAEGSAATAPANPVREGYFFIGWDSDFSVITSAITVTAQYDFIATITISPSELQLAEGESVDVDIIIGPEGLADKNVTYTVSPSDIIAFSNGIITGLLVGKATLTVTHSQGVSASCTVTVQAAGYMTDAYKEAIRTNRRGLWDAVVNVDGVDIKKDDILSLTLKEIEFESDKIGVGSVVSSYVEIIFWNANRKFLNKALTFKIGMQVGQTIEYAQFGTFYVTDAIVSDDDETIKVTAFDSIKKTTGISYTSKLTYPARIRTVAKEIVQLCGLELYPGIEWPDITLPSAIIAADCRAALAVIAQIMGANVVANRKSQVDFRLFKISDIVIDAEHRYYEFKKADMDTRIASVKVLNADGTYEVTSAVRSSETENCLSIQIVNEYANQDMADRIMENLSIVHRTGELPFLGDPSICVGDVITVRDKVGDTYTFPVMENVIEYDGGVKNTARAFSESMEAQEFTPKSGPDKTAEIQQQVQDLEQKIDDNYQFIEDFKDYVTSGSSGGDINFGDALGGLKVVSVSALPTNPDGNTIYLIQGTVVVE